MRLRKPAKVLALLAGACLVPLVLAQQRPEFAQAAIAAFPNLGDIAKDSLGNYPNLMISIASSAMGWEQPAKPFHLGGPIYFVGTKGLGAYLFSTGEGLVLFNTGMPGSGEMIAQSIAELGFSPADLKLILTGHAHVDHAGGHAYLQRLSGAKVVIMAQEQAKLASGGAADFFYAGQPSFRYEPPRIDGVVGDGDTIGLGELAFTAHLTPGHTEGATSWTTRISIDGKSYSVILPDGMGINPGYRLAVRPSSPGLVNDYRRTLAFLEQQRPDIWLPYHYEAADFEAKKASAITQGIAAWIDPNGYRNAIATARTELSARIEVEMAEE